MYYYNPYPLFRGRDVHTIRDILTMNILYIYNEFESGNIQIYRKKNDGLILDPTSDSKEKKLCFAKGNQSFIRKTCDTYINIAVRNIAVRIKEVDLY